MANYYPNNDKIYPKTTKSSQNRHQFFDSVTNNFNQTSIQLRLSGNQKFSNQNEKRGADASEQQAQNNNPLTKEIRDRISALKQMKKELKKQQGVLKSCFQNSKFEPEPLLATNTPGKHYSKNFHHKENKPDHSNMIYTKKVSCPTIPKININKKSTDELGNLPKDYRSYSNYQSSIEDGFSSKPTDYQISNKGIESQYMKTTASPRNLNNGFTSSRSLASQNEQNDAKRYKDIIESKISSQPSRKESVVEQNRISEISLFEEDNAEDIGKINQNKQEAENEELYQQQEEFSHQDIDQKNDVKGGENSMNEKEEESLIEISSLKNLEDESEEVITQQNGVIIAKEDNSQVVEVENQCQEYEMRKESETISSKRSEKTPKQSEKMHIVSSCTTFESSPKQQKIKSFNEPENLLSSIENPIFEDQACDENQFQIRENPCQSPIQQSNDEFQPDINNNIQECQKSLNLEDSAQIASVFGEKSDQKQIQKYNQFRKDSMPQCQLEQLDLMNIIDNHHFNEKKSQQQNQSGENELVMQNQQQEELHEQILQDQKQSQEAEQQKQNVEEIINSQVKLQIQEIFEKQIVEKFDECKKIQEIGAANTIQNVESNINKVQTFVQTMRSKAIYKNKQINDLKQKNQEYLNQISELKNSNSILIKDLDTMKQNHEIEKENFQSQIISLGDEKQLLLEELQNLKNDHEVLLQDNERLVTENLKFKVQFDSLKMQVHDHVEELHEEKENCKKFIDRIKRQYLNHAKQIQTQVLNFGKQNLSKQTFLQNTLSQKQEKMNDLQDQIYSYQEQVLKLQDDLHSQEELAEESTLRQQNEVQQMKENIINLKNQNLQDLKRYEKNIENFKIESQQKIQEVTSQRLEIEAQNQSNNRRLIVKVAVAFLILNIAFMLSQTVML